MSQLYHVRYHLHAHVRSKRITIVQAGISWEKYRPSLQSLAMILAWIASSWQTPGQTFRFFMSQGEVFKISNASLQGQ